MATTETILQECLKKLADGMYYKYVFDWVSPIVSKKHRIILFEVNGRFGYYNLRSKNLICDRTFELAKPFPLYTALDYTIVKENGKYNIIRYDGTLMLPKWAEYIGDTCDERFYVDMGDNCKCYITL